MRARVSAVLALLMLVLLPHPVAAASEAWVWPVAGDPEVLRPFAAPEHRYAAGHRGADVAAGPLAAVRAAGAGRVSYAGLLAGRGVVVVVHGDLRTTYEPVEASVRVGEPVSAGAVLGRISGAHAGCAGSCLHWGLRRGEDYLDPVRLVRRGPARLLPLPATADQLATGAGGAAASVEAGADAAAARPVRARPAAGSGPSLSLRSATSSWAPGALVLLLAGLALLGRLRRT